VGFSRKLQQIKSDPDNSLIESQRKTLQSKAANAVAQHIFSQKSTIRIFEPNAGIPKRGCYTERRVSSESSRLRCVGETLQTNLSTDLKHTLFVNNGHSSKQIEKKTSSYNLAAAAVPSLHSSRLSIIRCGTIQENPNFKDQFFSIVRPGTANSSSEKGLQWHLSAPPHIQAITNRGVEPSVWYCAEKRKQIEMWERFSVSILKSEERRRGEPFLPEGENLLRKIFLQRKRRLFKQSAAMYPTPAIFLPAVPFSK
jgi:hypothetical protein